MVEKRVIVLLEQGLHARPATRFVQTASAFRSDIKIAKNNKTAAAKSIMGVLALAVQKGDEILLTAEGPDEEKAVAELEKLLTTRYVYE